MSGSRPETWEHYYKMGVIEFLNLVSFYKAKQQIEINRRNLEKLKNGGTY